MAALRWILLLAGLAFLAGLVLWERHRSRREQQSSALRAREEPALGGVSEMPVESGQESRLERIRLPIPPVTDPPVVELPIEDMPRIDVHAQDTGTEIDTLPRIRPMDGESPAAGCAETPEAADSTTDAGPAAAAAAAAAPALIVEWPPESERHIVALRLVSADGERIAGRALRQALAAAGFLHGRFSIFHLPDESGRAVLSAASLSKPGMFDLENIDFHRFGGLNLFAVLPGPLPPAQALELLLQTAQALAQRLRGRLQDEHGQSLDVERVAALRASVAQLPPAT